MTFKISINAPALFLTAVGKDRLPVFQKEHIKNIAGEAINEAQTSCGFLLFAYVIMPDHVHLLTDAPRKPSEVLQYIKGIVGHSVIDYLKAHNYEASLEKLRMKAGSETIGTHCGSMIRTCFRLPANLSLWRR